MLAARCPAVAAVILILAGVPATAQHRPLLTLDPQPIPPGEVRAEIGVDYERERFFPLSGLGGDVLRAPYVGLTFGIGRVAEFQIDGGFNILSVDDRRPAPLDEDLDFTGDTTTDIEDPVVRTKILLQSETRRAPAVGFSVSTRLPSASNESGIGTDTITWSLAVLAGKTMGATRLVGNFGLDVVSLPLEGDRQNDLLTFAASVSHTVRPRLTVVAEARGRVDAKGTPQVGSEERGEIRIGARYGVHTLRLVGGVLVGLSDVDADYGFTLGVAHAFNGF